MNDTELLEENIREIDKRILELVSMQNTDNYREVEYRIEELIRLKGKIADVRSSN